MTRKNDGIKHQSRFEPTPYDPDGLFFGFGPVLTDEQSGFVPYMDLFRNKEYCGIHMLSHNFRGRLAQHADDLEW